MTFEIHDGYFFCSPPRPKNAVSGKVNIMGINNEIVTIITMAITLLAIVITMMIKTIKTIPII